MPPTEITDDVPDVELEADADGGPSAAELEAYEALSFANAVTRAAAGDAAVPDEGLHRTPDGRVIR